jgi:hypothetical protein
MPRGGGKRRKTRKKSKRPGKPAVSRPAAAASPALPAPRSHGELEDEPVFVLVDPVPDAKPVFEDDLEPPPPPPLPRRHRRAPLDTAAKRSLIRAALYASIAIVVALVVLWVLQSSDPNRVTPKDPPPIVQPQQ